MKQMNAKKYTGILLLSVLSGILLYSCTGDNPVLLPDEKDGSGGRLSLSVLLDAPEPGGEKSSGNPDTDAESKVYSLEVLVFKSGGEAEEGKLDGYGYVNRSTRDVTGQRYDKEYVEIDEIRGVGLTAGKRDIYVVANAPDQYFSTVTNYQGFLQKYEELYRQGRYPHPGNVNPDPDGELPIGGINPSDLKTNLTMCNYMTDVSFNNLYEQHYLGYTANNGRPAGVNPNEGWLLNGTNPFLVERLVARVAVREIGFDLPASLPFEGAAYPSGDYTYQIDSVFMMNVKTTSKFAAGSQAGFTEKFGFGCNVGFSFLNTPVRLNNLYPGSEYTDYLVESITTPYYDITANATPLWFYAFENEDSSYPTYLVIGVRYNFRSSKDGKSKTVKSYYPVVVNAPKAGKTADHDYIRRNYQYRITATIRGLGNMYTDNPVLIKSSPVAGADIEITEAVGRNLFPWTGDVYK